MPPEPRSRADYGTRQIEAARRVLVDLGQVLGSFFEDSIVVVGGWVPDLLIEEEVDEPHTGSIDVDLALNARKLEGGRYAQLVRTLLATGRYTQADEPFKLRATVDLGDRAPPVVVDVDFLKPTEKLSKRKKPRQLPKFRPLDAPACKAAFEHPQAVTLEGVTLSGAENTVHLQVASLPDFLIMKAFALAGRDKPKDAYDICYCLQHAPKGRAQLARDWRSRKGDALVKKAIAHLDEKFASVAAFGPSQVVAFYASASKEERELQAREAFELVRDFLRRVEEK